MALKDCSHMAGTMRHMGLKVPDRTSNDNADCLYLPLAQASACAGC